MRAYFFLLVLLAKAVEEAADARFGHLDVAGPCKRTGFGNAPHVVGIVGIVDVDIVGVHIFDQLVAYGGERSSHPHRSKRSRLAHASRCLNRIVAAIGLSDFAAQRGKRTQIGFGSRRGLLMDLRWIFAILLGGDLIGAYGGKHGQEAFRRDFRRLLRFGKRGALLARFDDRRQRCRRQPDIGKDDRGFGLLGIDFGLLQFSNLCAKIAHVYRWHGRRRTRCPTDRLLLHAVGSAHRPRSPRLVGNAHAIGHRSI